MAEINENIRQGQEEQQVHINNSSTSSSSSSSLIETQIFVPPSKSIGGIRYTPQSPAWHCCFSRNGEWLGACFGAPNPCIRLWRRRRRQQQQQQSSNDTTNKDSSCTTSKAAVAASSNESPWVFHSTLEFHERTIRCIAFCPLSSSYTLAAASFDGTVTIWEHNQNTDVWDCTTQLEGHENEVKCVTWNATGSLLATCGRDKTVWIWETFLDGSIGGSADNEFECLAVLNGHEGDVKTVRFAPSHGIWGDGDEILISASYDDSIKIWAEDAGDWYCAFSIQDVQTDTIWSLAVAPGGGRVISASADGSLAIFKSYTPAERKELFPEDDKNNKNNNNHGLFKCVGLLSGAHDQSAIYSIDYAPARAGHGRVVSAGNDNRIQIYREIGVGSTSDKPLFTIDVAVDTNHGDVNCVCWHPQDGSILCSAGDDGTVRIWRFEL
ncbi:MAG: WD40 repeat protein [Bacillariaceae sp.]|jgi:WD40 repeat protein